MPPSECCGRISWPDIGVPRTVIEVSDLNGHWFEDHDDEALTISRPHLVVPAMHHVEQILELGAALLADAPADPQVLVHCHAGVSRSVAAAYLLLALEDGPGQERQSYERLRQAWGSRLAPTPNAALVRMGDEALGRGGRLADEVERNLRLEAPCLDVNVFL